MMKSLATLRNSFASLLFVSAAIYAAGAYAEVVVIVSGKSAITRLTPDQVTRIFLDKIDTFPDGANAVPVDQSEGSPVRNEFYTKVVHKNASQMAAYWTRIIFTGDGYPPRQLGNDADIRKEVANNPNAIGYVDRKFVDSSVRIILEP